MTDAFFDEPPLKRLDPACEGIVDAMKEGYALVISTRYAIATAWDCTLVAPPLSIVPKLPRAPWFFPETRNIEERTALHEREWDRVVGLHNYSFSQSQRTMNECLVSLADQYAEGSEGQILGGMILVHEPTGCKMFGSARNGGLGCLGDIVYWDNLVGRMEGDQIRLSIPGKHGGFRTFSEAENLTATGPTLTEAFYNMAVLAKEEIGSDLVARTGRCGPL